jgi:arsenate reductase (glutaredoxin)
MRLHPPIRRRPNNDGPTGRPRLEHRNSGVAVTIWHNPKCATSRKVLDMIRAAGISPQVVDYVKTPPSAAAIRSALKAMGMKPRALLRRKGTPYEELGLDDPKLTDSALIAAMHEHPILIERPVVQTPKGARLCRPPERLHEIL